MEFTFENVRLRSLCEKRRQAKGALGASAARELERCLADMMACENVAAFNELIDYETTGRSDFERVIRLQAGYDLVFTSGHVRTPLNEFGAPDWTQVTRIKIIALEATDAKS